MRVFSSSAMVIGTVFLLFASLHGQIPRSDPDYVPPQIVTTPRLTPPKEAVDSGLGGIVRVGVSIDKDGNVTSAEEPRGPGNVCRQVTRPDVTAIRNAAREAALLAKFTPATRKGRPIESSTWLSFTFPGREKRTELGASASSRSKGAPKGSSDLGAANTSPQDGNKYTVKGNGNFTVRNDPPPDYAGPVNVAGAAQGGKAPGSGNIPGQISGGVLNGKAASLPKPPYPAAARAVRASGAVSVQVLIDENGEVFTAEAISGHPLLRAASAQAACGSKFLPTTLGGNPVKVSGVIVYNFVP